MLFSISQKLIQHQILNYTEILKWLREILICHIQFLQKHRDYANVGSNIPICRQAHIKLEVSSALFLLLLLTPGFSHMPVEWRDSYCHCYTSTNKSS